MYDVAKRSPINAGALRQYSLTGSFVLVYGNENHKLPRCGTGDAGQEYIVGLLHCPVKQVKWGPIRHHR